MAPVKKPAKLAGEKIGHYHQRRRVCVIASGMKASQAGEPISSTRRVNVLGRFTFLSFDSLSLPV